MDPAQEEKKSLWFKLKRFILECRRVLRVTKKPTNQEFKAIVKVSALGVTIIGLIGFMIAIIKSVLF